LRGCVGASLRKASTDRLLDPYYVGEIGPVPWVVDGAGS
jgi:hypothetical protein